MSDEPNPLADMFENLGRAMRAQGPVDWESALQTAHRDLTDAGLPSSAAESAFVAALQLANLWLNQETQFTEVGGELLVLSRRDWIDRTFADWKVVVDPVASGIADAMSQMIPTQPMDLPEEIAGLLGANLTELLGPMQQMARSMGAAIFGQQFGAALAQLAGEVLSLSDIGLPIGPDARCGFIPANIDNLAESLALPTTDVYLYVTLRESARQRLFAAAPWLRSQILAAVRDFANGVHVDTSALGELIGQINPADPEALNQVMSSGLLEPARTPAQEAALARLELLLALAEGWVAQVTTAAIGGRLPNEPAISEAFRRRDAAGGPAQQLFSGLVGLELRPRLAREAQAMWAALTSEQRDQLWTHPDLLPTAEELANPESIAQRDAVDDELRRWLDEEN